MTYAELLQAVQDYTENRNATFVANIPRMVRMAERRIYLAAKLPRFRRTQVAGAPPNAVAINAPSDFLLPYSLSFEAAGQVHFLDQKEPEYLRSAYPGATPGRPRFYAVQGNSVLSLAPATDALYFFELQYFYFPESIVSASSTWLGDNFDQVLLYGCLLETAAYMKEEPDVVQGYAAQYTASLQQMTEMVGGYSPDAYRSQR